ncbi:hypothetical protein [Tenacibaculum phage JQ]|nr:hypothetical protein [Tenacibaculum phage JQ]
MKVSKFRTVETPAIVERVLKEYYRTELKPNETIIDNRDGTISKLTGVSISLVKKIITRDLDEKFRIAYEREEV